MEEIMNTRLFLDELEAYLKTELDDTSVRYHLDYYRNYIEMEVEQGKNEFEVIEALGNPRVIGKNIVLTQQMNNDMKAGYTPSYQDSKESKTPPKENLPERIKKYAVIAAVIFIIILILALVLKVVFLVLPILLIFVLLSYFINSSGKR